MKIELVTRADDLCRASLVVIGVFADGTLTPSADRLPPQTRDRVAALVAAGELPPRIGARIPLYGLSADVPAKILLVFLGASARLSDTAYRAVLAAAAQTLAESTSREAVVTLTEVEVADRAVDWRIEQAARLLADGAYRFTLPTAGQRLDTSAHAGVDTVALVVPGSVETAHEAAARRGLAVAEGLALARDLGNLPSSICTPGYLGDTARRLARQFGLTVEIFEQADLEKLAMGALLAVGRADQATGRLIVLGYRGSAPAARPIVLIGEGLTFDAGRIVSGPGADAGATKSGMSGAGAVLGTLLAVARLRLPLNVVGLLPTAEIVAGASRSRPGDVVRTMSGQTVEILSADEAGRLALCDALSYTEHFDPACVIDVAAPGGPSAVPFGGQASSLFANDADLAHDLLASGMESGDRAWLLPLWDEDQLQLDSPVADMSSHGGPMTEAATAAGFLLRFAGHTRWAHLDIAGTARLAGAGPSATGRPVALLTGFLVRRAGRRRPSAARPAGNRGEGRSRTPSDIA